MASVAENKDETKLEEQSQAGCSDETSWKHFQQDKQTRLEALHEAVASRDLYSLLRAIYKCKNIDSLSEKEIKELRKAQLLLTVENYRIRLMHAIGEDYPNRSFLRWQKQYSARSKRRRHLECLRIATMDKDFETLNDWVDIYEKYNLGYMCFEEKRVLEIAKKVLLDHESIAEGGKQQQSEQDAACNMNSGGEAVKLYHYLASNSDSNYKELISIIREIKNHENKNIRAALQQDIIFAECKAEQLKRKFKNNKAVKMDRKTLSELRRYINPPRILQRLMQAVFLILGEDIYDIQIWEACLTRLNPGGSYGIIKRMTELDPELIPEERYSSAKFLLDDIDEITHERLITLPEVQKVSLAAASFYVWARGVIEECEKTHGVQAEEEYVPDHIKAMRHGKAPTMKRVQFLPMSPRKLRRRPKKHMTKRKDF